MMKTVVFASIYDAARSKMAAAFFNAFTMPSLVRGVSAGACPLLWVVPEIVQVMKEVGLDVSARPQLLPSNALESAALIVTFADLGPWRTPAGVPRESWDLPNPRVREIRDHLRERVWKLLAKHGWYRLQPTAVLRHRTRREHVLRT